MKKLLIISPHFPPINAADMHRVRQSLPYFIQFGWEVEIIAVAEEYVEISSKDELLIQTIPTDIVIHFVKAFSVEKTRKLGLGNLGLRSLWYFLKAGNTILKSKKFDLIYFSTTVFPVMVLGRYWLQKFGVPYILDMQDPWRGDFYLDKPKHQRPPKFWFAYNLDKYLEAYAVPKAAGIVSVSKGYCDTLTERYASISEEKCCVIPFGGSEIDFKIMEQHIVNVKKIHFESNKINIVYIGRGGHDLSLALNIFFAALKQGLETEYNLFESIHAWFIGTSYAKTGTGKQTILPIANNYGLVSRVTEITDRLPYFETLFLLRQSNIIFIPGSTDINYTASKLYPNILAEKPLISLFHKSSSVVSILEATCAGVVHTFDSGDDINQHLSSFYEKLKKIITALPFKPETNWKAFQPYTSEAMTEKQSIFFNKVLNTTNEL